MTPRERANRAFRYFDEQTPKSLYILEAAKAIQDAQAEALEHLNAPLLPKFSRIIVIVEGKIAGDTVYYVHQLADDLLKMAFAPEKMIGEMIIKDIKENK